MAQGNESDLVVSIAVDTTAAREGFEKVAALSEQYAQRIGKMWDNAFKGTLDTKGVGDSMNKVVREMKTTLKPLTDLSSGKYGPGKVVFGGAEGIKQAQDAIKTAILEAREVQRAQTKEQRDKTLERQKKARELKQKEVAEQKRLNDLKEKEKQKQQAINEAYRKALLIIRTMSRIFRFVINSAKELTRTSSAIYDQQFKLAAALRAHNELTDGQVRNIYKQVDAMSELTGLSREVNYSAAQILSSYIGAADGLTDMLGTVDALTLKMYGYNATAENSATIARIIGRAMSGNLQTLKRYGIELTAAEEALVKSSTATRLEKTQTLMAAIARITGDLSQYTNTWSGQTNLTKVRIEAIKNELGLALQNMLLPVVRCVNVILEGVTQIAKWMRYISIIAFGKNVKGAEELADGATKADEALEQLETRLLGFDKFNVLGGSDANGGGFNFGDTTGLAEAEGDVPEWVETLSKIGPLADALKVALIGIGGALAIIATHMATIALKGVVAHITQLIAPLTTINATLGITKLNVLGLALGIGSLVTGIVALVQGFRDIGKWNEMTGMERFLAILKLLGGALFVVVGAILIWKNGLRQLVFKLIEHNMWTVTSTKSTLTFGAALKTTALWAAALGAAALGIGVFVSNLEKMGTVTSIIVGVTAAITALAAAIIALKVAQAGPLAAIQAAMIAGGITLAVGTMLATIPKMANGGIPDRGQLFIANEAGPELVGNIGGRTSVANNAMITSAIEEAAYRGFSRANGNGGGNMTLTIQGDAVRNDALVRALMPALKTEVKRQGGIAKAFKE